MRRMQLESKLHDFLTGECDAATRVEVEALLQKDAKARALLEEMRDAHEALLMLRDRPAPEAPVDDIRRAIATRVFAGKPEPVMAAWGTQFYKRVAAAALIVGGVSVGFAVQSSLNRSGNAPDTTITTQPSEDAASDARTVRLDEGRVDDGAIPPAEKRGYPVRGVDAYELMQRTNGNLVTLTPTDSVMPVFEPEPR